MKDFVQAYDEASRSIPTRMIEEIISRNSSDGEMRQLHRVEGESDIQFVRRIVATYVALSSGQET